MYLKSMNEFTIITYESGYVGKTVEWNKTCLFLAYYKGFVLIWVLCYFHNNTVFITMSSYT